MRQDVRTLFELVVFSSLLVARSVQAECPRRTQQVVGDRVETVWIAKDEAISEGTVQWGKLSRFAASDLEYQLRRLRPDDQDRAAQDTCQTWRGLSSEFRDLAQTPEAAAASFSFLAEGVVTDLENGLHYGTVGTLLEVSVEAIHSRELPLLGPSRLLLFYPFGQLKIANRQVCSRATASDDPISLLLGKSVGVLLKAPPDLLQGEPPILTPASYELALERSGRVLLLPSQSRIPISLDQLQQFWIANCHDD